MRTLLLLALLLPLSAQATLWEIHTQMVWKESPEPIEFMPAPSRVDGTFETDDQNKAIDWNLIVGDGQGNGFLFSPNAPICYARDSEHSGCRSWSSPEEGYGFEFSGGSPGSTVSLVLTANSAEYSSYYNHIVQHADVGYAAAMPVPEPNVWLAFVIAGLWMVRKQRK